MKERPKLKQQLDLTDLAQIIGLTKLDVTEEQLKEIERPIEEPKEPTKADFKLTWD